MIIDKLMTFSDNQSVRNDNTNSDTTAEVWGENINFGVGTKKRIGILIQATYATKGNLLVQLQTSDSKTFASDVTTVDLGTIASGDLLEGTFFERIIGPGEWKGRYAKLNYKPSATLSADGRIFAALLGGTDQVRYDKRGYFVQT